MTDSQDPAATPHHLTLRQTRLDDYPDIYEIMERVYPDLDGAWSQDQFTSQITRFPEGQICIEDNGKVVAAAISLIVEYRRFGDQHNYWQITGNGFLTTHDPDGDTLYGVDIFVHPDYRGLRLGRRLYDARKELCEKLNLRAIVAGGRIPGYARVAGEMTPQQYVEKVKNHEIRDPILSFQLANDFHVRKIITDYLPADDKSVAYATLIEWLNIYHEEKEKLIGGSRSDVRVGVVQWQMRPTATLDDLFLQIEYFVDAVSGYRADAVLFPEFFNGPLMGQFNQENPAEAVRSLAEFTDAIREEMVRLALAYNINIIAGTMPEYEDGELRNVSYLCRRDGTWDRQYKIHVTPDEVSFWGLQGGDDVRVFDTDFGKVGILICYDVEFPELPRLMAEQGLQILFVPFWTDTKTAYLRVRRCAQARAIENECYVVISGSVGNLPKVENMDMQYSQAAVFTPSDFAFPHDAVAAEATPNTEMTLIVDLDLDNLKELRNHGSVRNLRDRRRDLYEVVWKGRAP
ncbi:MAG: GNAT family N-acetyltransferase [Thioalkalivibrio sp.]|nr:MAG: GNAT family N-acetyltransferase [Thioalkalivibrio sp.]